MWILILSPIFLFKNCQNERIEKEIKASKLKQLDQEGQNYRLVISADNVQVPVPKGYVASQIEGENYVTPEYSHTTIQHKGNYTQLNWSSPAGETYPWTLDENGIWISGNQGIPSSTSTLESEEFDYIKGTTLTIKYTYSSNWGDLLNINLINLTNNTTQRIVDSLYGNTNTSFDYTTSTYTYTMKNWGTGRYKIKAIYSKNASTDGGQDSGYIKVATYFKEDENRETLEVDQKTKIHDGGFVIYQLTDEEIETDPNGTNVIINDANKETSQNTRNQYVWVPVSNVEDITRTRTSNKGIMQFGQGYKFSDTAITKETSTSTKYFKEPRLIEEYDKTKHYLQRYSNLDKRENYLIEQQKDFTKMIKSINKYKGFYIGRYETGDEYSHNESNTCYINPKIVRYNCNINNVTWYDSYKDLKRLSGKTEKYVETGLLYDTMWEYTLKWLNETDTRSYEEINKDSATWGNYANSFIKYKESENGIENTIDINEGVMIPTGGVTEIIYKGKIYSDSPTSSNNIFDLAGNIQEWDRTRENTYSRRYRGGYYLGTSDKCPASNSNYFNPFVNNSRVGTRGMIYIM